MEHTIQRGARAPGLRAGDLRIGGATRDEITYESSTARAPGERIVAELPRGVLLPPRPTHAHVVAAYVEGRSTSSSPRGTAPPSRHVRFRQREPDEALRCKMGDEDTQSGEVDEFKVWIAGQGTKPGHLGLSGATLKKGRDVCKVATLALFGKDGVASHRELRCKTAPRKPDAPGFDFDNPKAEWSCEDDEIEKLLAFLREDFDRAGRYRIIDMESPVADLLRVVEGNPNAFEEVVERAGTDKLGAALAASDEGLNAAELAVVTRRRMLITTLRELIADPKTTETDIQAEISKDWWIFGGRYVGALTRRDLLKFDQHDIPLVTGDHSLHIVELKGSNIPKLVREHRTHWIVGNDVHDATMQAANYVRSADEQGLAMRTLVRDELGIDIDLRRTFATVVIGTRAHARQGATDENLSLALRTYNATINRVEVITYDDLLDAAERSLDFDV
jgi:Domain of unknown function (DUF4263)